MFQRNYDEEVLADQNMSQSMYVMMCHKIGTPQQVALRRDLIDMGEFIANEVMKKSTPNRVMLSGSVREGFKIEGSDQDEMYWTDNHRVLRDASKYKIEVIPPTNALVLCESSESPPGFTLLWLPLKFATANVLSARVEMNGEFYISSSIYREITDPFHRPELTTHGPCRRGTYGDFKEHDVAHCFVGDFWPPSASSWIERCKSWPTYEVVNDIVTSGCHFVAIGHQLGNHEAHEWRISFSRAEYKIVYSMNHTQFLTYGLLKLFLQKIKQNELKEENTPLCSYHMKTAVFWAIQQNSLFDWCPQNLLTGFWVCFKYILKWVYEGVCPNFFIPQNNIFLGKIYGHTQAELFMRLYNIYEKGIVLLLHSLDIPCMPKFTINLDCCSLISEADLDKEFFSELREKAILPRSDIKHSLNALHIVEELISSDVTQYQVVLLQKVASSVLQKIAFLLHNMLTNFCVNKKLYIAQKRLSYMLKLASKIGCASDMLYIAMYYYKTFRYRKALSVIDKAKDALEQPYMMYHEQVNPKSYTDNVGGQPLSTKMRKAVVCDIKLMSSIVYIDELMLEQEAIKDIRDTALVIPPLLLLHMLDFLCSRHVDAIRAQTALYGLKELVYYGQDIFTSFILGDISWEILGICQQISGNIHSAKKSYQKSLQQYPSQKIAAASKRRIQDLP